MTENLTLAIVLGAALVDSINPCAIGVLLFLSSVLLKVSKKRQALWQLGGVYVLTVYVVYVLSGLGLIWFQHTLIRKGFAEIVGSVVGVFVIGLGLIEIKDFFWHGKGLSLEIPSRYKDKIAQMTENLSFVSVIALGGFVAAVELPCTGGPYLAITTMLARSFDTRAFLYLLVYNFIFVLPLLVMLGMIYFGFSTLQLKRWRQDQRPWMNLALGTLMISLGAFLIVYYQGGWHL